MSKANPVNIAASVRQKILNKARNEGRQFSELVQYYSLERFLYRLSISEHSDNFILKGALLLRAWGLIKQIADVSSMEVEGDGLQFDPNSIQSEQITEDADYIGNRITFEGKLDTIKINMQIDIGFGDSVFPEPVKYSLPCILDFPIAKLTCYKPETTIAEKFEAMVKLGEVNSRIKDFFDILLLAKSMDFEKNKLAESINKTFQKRGTQIPEKFMEFSNEFISKRQTAWTSFIRKNGIENVPDDFGKVIEIIQAFLDPIINLIKKL
jgi:nucleotidyltransferase AbiEii toxin of type IV toxin-antitoxin system